MPDIHQFEPLFGSWVLEDEIGRGSYGSVYRAHSIGSGAQRLAAVIAQIEVLEARLEGNVNADNALEVFFLKASGLLA